ncbi:MAG: DUF302 domain-containing protein [Anaerolineae bacterium]|nr:DUF302 domain-containing protein [Anaerolineae bacterium]RIK15800.1 MAG: ABC transporter ATP-binding protein [Anaerolineae bacterium]
MDTTTVADYGMRTRLDMPYEQAIEAVTAALKTEGFGVLTQIDVKDTLKQKINAEFRRYIILGACNPHLAHRAFTTELEIGLLLPCNVIVYEDGDGSIVSIVDPIAMLGVGLNPDLASVGEEASARLRRVLAALE